MKWIKMLIPVVITALICWLLYSSYQKNNKVPVKELAIMGNEGHVIKDFSFLDQNGKTVTLDDIKGKVLVVEYFFTTCQTICPVMNQEMMKVDSAFRDESNFRILSHSVDPETDTVEAMKVYADQHKASKNWIFLTGSKENLYKAARESYLLGAPKDPSVNKADDFIHTQNFALIDKEGRIRGFYDGTKPEEVMGLITDVKILLGSSK